MAGRLVPRLPFLQLFSDRMNTHHDPPLATQIAESAHRDRAPWWHVLAFVAALLALAALFVIFAGAGTGVKP